MHIRTASIINELHHADCDVIAINLWNVACDTSPFTCQRLPANTSISCACAWCCIPCWTCTVISKRWFPFHQAQWDQVLYCLSYVINLPQSFSRASSKTHHRWGPTNAWANFQDGVWLDVAADGCWWSRCERAFFDVKGFQHAPTPTQTDELNYLTCYHSHEASKKRAYERGILKVDTPPLPHSSSLPLVAAQLSAKWDHSY